MIAIQDLDYLVGHLRYGHIECQIPEDFKEEFLSMSPEDQRAYVREEGHLVVDDFEVDDFGYSGDISIIE